MNQIQFYFGLGSRYSYIAATQIARIEKEEDVRFDWLPIFSGKLIEQSNPNLFAPENQRGQYSPEYRTLDAQRWAHYYSIPFKEPNVEAVDWSNVVRACLAAKFLGQIDVYALAVYDDVFVKGLPPRTEIRLIELAKSIGLCAAEFQDLLVSGLTAAEEEKVLNNAISSNVFGVPSFVVDREIFWGQDRIPLLIQHLKKHL